MSQSGGDVVYIVERTKAVLCLLTFIIFFSLTSSPAIVFVFCET